MFRTETGAPSNAMKAAWDELAELYRRTDDALSRLSGKCRGCGGCCRFLDGFVLYTAALERSYLLAHAPRPASMKRGGECPYLVGDDCIAREWRPLGCRTYLCDPCDMEARHEIYEGALREISKIGERHGMDRDYAPMLERLRASRRGSSPGPAPGGEQALPQSP